MRKQSLCMLFLVVAGFLFLSGWTSGAKPSTKVTWEYKVVSVYGASTTNPAPDVGQLNHAGADGWELVAIRSGNFPAPDSKQVRTDFYFKR